MEPLLLPLICINVATSDIVEVEMAWISCHCLLKLKEIQIENLVFKTKLKVNITYRKTEGTTG